MSEETAFYAELIQASSKAEKLGRMGDALRHAARALEIAQACGASEQVAGALVRLAMVHFHQGNYPLAHELAQNALEHAPRASPGRARAFLMLGGCAAETNSIAEAEGHYHRALNVAREIGDGHLVFSSLHALAANLFLPRGQFELALATDQEAYQVACEHQLDDYLYYPLITIAWAYRLTGQRKQTRRALQELERASQNSAIPLAYHHSMSAELLAEAGCLDEAFELHTRALSLAVKCGEPALNVDIRLGLSRFYRLSQQTSAAYDWASEAAAYAARVGYSHRHSMALIERARVCLDMGNWSAAEADLRTAIAALTPLQANCDLAHACLLLAAALHSQQLPESEAAWLEAAQRIIQGGYGFLLEAERPLALPLLAHYSNSPDPCLRQTAAALVERLKQTPPLPLQITALGGFEVRRAGRPIPRSSWQRRCDELFRLLLVSPNRSLSREQIIELLWPEKPPEVARVSLNQATSCLRRALEPDLPEKFPSRYLLVEDRRITLCLSPDSRVDYEDFQALVRQAQWKAALELYAGEPFPLDRYKDWAAWVREELIDDFLRASLAVARLELNEGDVRVALRTCQQVLAEDPWQEEAALLGMRACLRLGDRPAALHIYLEIERRLKKDLDISPQPELQALYRSLL